MAVEEMSVEDVDEATRALLSCLDLGGDARNFCTELTLLQLLSAKREHNDEPEMTKALHQLIRLIEEEYGVYAVEIDDAYDVERGEYGDMLEEPST